MTIFRPVRAAWPSADIWTRQAQGTLADDTPCPGCGCPFATHQQDPSVKAFYCPLEIGINGPTEDQLRRRQQLFDMLKKAPKLPKLDPALIPLAKTIRELAEKEDQALREMRQREAAELAEKRDELRRLMEERRYVAAPPPRTIYRQALREMRQREAATSIFAAREDEDDDWSVPRKKEPLPRPRSDVKPIGRRKYNFTED